MQEDPTLAPGVQPTRVLESSQAQQVEALVNQEEPSVEVIHKEPSVEAPIDSAQVLTNVHLNNPTLIRL